MSGRLSALLLVLTGLGLTLVMLSPMLTDPSDVLAVEPGVNCSSYTGPGGVCLIDVGDIWFCDASYQDGVCPTSIVAGDTVRWEYPSTGQLMHTTTECGADCDDPTSTPLWDSGTLEPGDSFEFAFTTPGQYLYYCMFHPTTQRGLIRILEPIPTPTATATPTAISIPPPTPTGQPTATATPAGATSTPTQGSAPGLALPATGSSGGGAGIGWTATAGLVLAAGGLLLLGWGLRSRKPRSLSR